MARQATDNGGHNHFLRVNRQHALRVCVSRPTADPKRMVKHRPAQGGYARRRHNPTCLRLHPSVSGFFRPHPLPARDRGGAGASCRISRQTAPEPPGCVFIPDGDLQAAGSRDCSGPPRSRHRLRGQAAGVRSSPFRRGHRQGGAGNSRPGRERGRRRGAAHAAVDGAYTDAVPHRRGGDVERRVHPRPYWDHHVLLDGVAGRVGGIRECLSWRELRRWCVRNFVALPRLDFPLPTLLVAVAVVTLSVIAYCF